MYMLPSITCGSADTGALAPIAATIAVCTAVLLVASLKSACANGPSIVHVLVILSSTHCNFSVYQEQTIFHVEMIL